MWGRRYGDVDTHEFSHGGGSDRNHRGGRVLDPRIVAAWAEPWLTWGVAEIVVFLGGLFSEPLTVTHGVLLFVSGMVVAATALGSRSGIQQVIHLRSGRPTP